MKWPLCISVGQHQ